MEPYTFTNYDPRVHVKEYEPIEEIEQEKMPIDLKIDINGFLFTRLPPTMTLDKADEIACEVCDLVETAWTEYYSGI